MVWSNSWSPLTGMEKVANVCVQVLVWSVTPSSSFSSFPPFSHPHHLSCYCCCCCQSLSHCQNHYCLSLRKIRPSLLSWQNPLEAQSSSSSLWFCYPSAHTFWRRCNHMSSVQLEGTSGTYSLQHWPQPSFCYPCRGRRSLPPCTLR